MNGITQSTALWYASRATGVVSLLLLTAIVLLGVLVNRQGRLPGLPRFVVTGLHRNLSLLGVAFVAIHVITAVADPYVSIRIVAIVLPFASAYKPLWLGLGAISLDLVLALILTSLARARMSRRLWRSLHWLSYLAWVSALVHSLGCQQRPAQRHPALPGDRLRPGGHRRGGLAVHPRRAGDTARGARGRHPGHDVPRQPPPPPGSPRDGTRRSAPENVR